MKKRIISLLLAVSMLFSMCITTALAATSVTVSGRMETVDEAKGIYKMVFSAYSPAGVSTMSTVFSYDSSLIVPLNHRAGDVDFPVSGVGVPVIPTVNVLLVDAYYSNYGIAAANGYVVGDRTGILVDIYSANPLTAMTESADVFEFYFRLADGKTVDDFSKATFRIEKDKSAGSILATIYNESALADAAGLKLTDKAADGDTTYVYAGQPDDGIAVTLTYPGSDKQSLDTVTLSAEPTDVTVDGVEDQVVTLTPTAVDVDGETYPTTDVTYELKDGGTGATVSGNTITIPAAAEAGTITVTAQLAGKTSNTVSIIVSRAASVPAAVEITGADSVSVPVDGSSEETYTAAVTDQYGSAMAGEKVVWSMEPADTAGITLADGILTVTKDAAPSGSAQITIKAQAGEVSGEKTVTVSRAEPEPTYVKVTLPEQSVTAPALKDQAVDVQAKAAVTDQYGTEIAGAAIVWELTEAPAGVTMDDSGKITVAPAAEAGKVTVKATSGELSGTASFEVVRGTSAAAEAGLYRGEAKVGEADTLIIPVEGANEYTYTVKVLDQYGAGMEADIDWTFATADDKVTFADGKVTVNAGAVKDTTYTLTAAVAGTEVKASTVITVKDIEITWPTVTVKENPVYGDTWAQIVSITGGSASINGEAVSGSFSVKNADVRPNAGASSYVLNFTSDDKAYDVDYTGAEVTVAPKELTITGVAATDRSYDQTTTVAVTGGTLVGVLDGDTVNASVPATGTVEAPDAGTGLAVTLGEITLDNPNYTLVQPTGITVTITKAEITKLDVPSVSPVTVLASSVDSIDAVKGKIPVAKAVATFGDGLEEEVTITWTTSDGFAANTDKTYTFTGTVGTDNLDGSKLTALTAQVIVTVKYPVEVTVTAPADVTYGETLGDPAAAQVDAGYNVAADASWKFEYEGADDTTYARSETKPTQAGSYVVYATLVSGTHAGSGVSATFKINPKDIASAAVAMPEEYEAVYTGTAFEPEVIVTDGETTLVKGTDYTLSYTGNVNAGTATVTVTGVGNYTGTNSTCTFEIDKASLAELTPTIVGTAQVGGVLTAKLANVSSSEYTWKWYYKVDGEPDHAEITAAAGKASFVVTSELSNKEIYAEAVAKDDSNYEGVTLSSEPVTVAKQAITGTVTILAPAGETIGEGTRLEADVKISPDMAVTYQWFVNGTAVEGETGSGFDVPADSADKSITVAVTPAGEDYTGSITSAAVVVGKTMLTGSVTLSKDEDLITAVVEDAETESYDVVWLRNGAVISGATDTVYTVTSADQGAEISAKLVAKGDYTGEILSNEVSVAVDKPAAPTVSASAGNGKVTLSWSVADNGGAPITSYTVQCGKDAPIVLDAATTSYTFDNLENGTKYTFQVTATNSAGTSDATVAEATPKTSSGGGGGGGGVTTYTVTVEQADNGSVTASTKSAAKDATVTLTITPDEGYRLDTLTVANKNGVKLDLTRVSDSKYTFKMPASAVTVQATFVEKPAEGTLPFTDVASSAWYYEAVAYVYNAGMMTGTNDGTTFSPAMSLTRGMMAQVLYNLEQGNAGIAGSFTDVADGAWYADAVNWAASKGIVNGYGDGRFGPEDSITREQMALLLYNYANFKGYDLTATTDLAAFTDGDQVSDWALYAMKWAVAEGLIQGSNNSLNPLGTASRAEVAQILMNFDQNVVK